jgi:ubiquinone/menaquinone biosynthesis C-methylase UbiE
MLRRAARRARAIDMSCVQGNSMRLPFREAAFDFVVLHLILTVVPDGAQALREAARVTKAGGRLLVFDKFLRRGERAAFRRALSPLAGRIVTRTDVVFEDLLRAAPGLAVQSDEPGGLGGWFRHITLVRAG